MNNTIIRKGLFQPSPHNLIRWIPTFYRVSFAGTLLVGCLTASAQSPPVITSQPKEATNYPGTTAIFSVKVTGTEPLAFQWQHAFASSGYVNLQEETKGTLVIPSVGETDVGTYRVIVSNVVGTVTSDPAPLYIFLPNDPNIYRQPTNQTPSQGGTATFVARGTTVNPPLTWQWQFRESLSATKINLPGATKSTLTLTNVTATQNGYYSVVITNYIGSFANSIEAALVVDRTFTKITAGPVATDVADSWCASWGDYDNDGYPDLFVARARNALNALYHNNGDGTFTRITNVLPPTSGDWTSGLWVDFDNDGQLDLFAVRDGTPAFFYFNDGDGTFSTQQFASMSPWSTSGADYDRDGLLDLYTSYLYSGKNYLYRNLGGRKFQLMQATQVGPMANVATFGGLAWADYNDDGWPDVFAPDFRNSRILMYPNEGTGRFVAASNVVTREGGAAIAGAWGDYDNDGKLDLAVARMDGASAVYHNLGNGQFERAAIGVTLGNCNSLCWADYDNDGFLDLFLTYVGGNKNALYHNNGDGTFTKVTTGSLVMDVPMGGAGSYNGLWFDYDNDGFLDLFVSNGSDAGTASTSNFLYRNNGNSNAWLVIKPVGTTSNRSAIGAKVRVSATFAGQARWLRRDISSGDAFNGNNLFGHFGLGDATNVDLVRIEWPSGTIQELKDIAVRQFLTVTEPRRPVLTLETKDGNAKVQIIADPNLAHEVHVSEDLIHWTLLTKVTTDATGCATCSEKVATSGNRFFKAIRR